MDFVFPAVFYLDEENENYIVSLEDVQIYCQGKTVEEAFYTARRYLKDFCNLSLKVYGEVQEVPTSYIKALLDHKGHIVMLVDAEVKPPREKKRANA